jgi:hypothetical protein
MPLLLAISWLAYDRAGRDVRRASLWAAAGFLLPFLVAIPWIWSHPEMLRDTLARYLPAEGKPIATLSRVRDKIGEYWDYFDPAYLFLTGGASLTTSTGRAGVLLAPCAVFLPLGMLDLLKRSTSAAMPVVLLGGFALSAVPATLFGERYMIQRELIVVPFAVLVAVFGVAFLLRQRNALVRWATIALLAAIPLQFAYVCRDYFTHYKVRSAFWYDPAAFRDVAEPVIAADAARELPAVYLRRDVDDAGPKWRFFVTKHHRESLLRRTRYFDDAAADLADAPRGSMAVLYAHPYPQAALTSGHWIVADTAVDPDGRSASLALEKVRE